jgi:hypothetical protein
MSIFLFLEKKSNRTIKKKTKTQKWLIFPISFLD